MKPRLFMYHTKKFMQNSYIASGFILLIIQNLNHFLSLSGSAMSFPLPHAECCAACRHETDPEVYVMVPANDEKNLNLRKNMHF